MQQSFFQAIVIPVERKKRLLKKRCEMSKFKIVNYEFDEKNKHPWNATLFFWKSRLKPSFLLSKSTFFNYVDKILAFFDHLSTYLFMTPDLFQFNIIEEFFSYKFIRLIRDQLKTWISAWKLIVFYKIKSQQTSKCMNQMNINFLNKK